MPRQKGFAHVLVLIIAVFGIVLVGGYLFYKNQYRQSILVDYNICDIDQDGDCDKTDRLLFDRVVGECIDGDNYNELADADNDGCITDKDALILFSSETPKPLVSPSENSNGQVVYTPDWILEKGDDYIINQVGKSYFDENFILDFEETERLNKIKYTNPPNPYFRYSLIYIHKGFSDFTGEEWSILIQLDKNTGDIFSTGGKAEIDNCLKGISICNFSVDKDEARSIAKERSYDVNTLNLSRANTTEGGWTWTFWREKNFSDGCTFEFTLEINIASGEIKEKRGSGTCP